MLRSLRSLSLVLAITGLLAPATAHAATAHKKKSKVSYPSVSKVSPLKVGIGDNLVIRGKSFRSGKGRNYVVFKRDGGRPLFVKAGTASKTKLTVAIPAKLLGYLTQTNGAPQPTRFRLRILAGHLGKSYTKNSRSPLISPTPTGGPAGDCDSDGVSNGKDSDDDNDLLSDDDEAAYGTDPCKRDSDGDGMSDGWEVQSAKDRNGGIYPKSKPSPNPNDKSDAAIDSDGDGLTNLEEYSAWATFGGNRFPLSYSGGNVASAGRYAVPAEQKYLDRDNNGFLSDFERDADGDGIANMDEVRTSFDMARVATGQAADDPAFYDFGVFTQQYIEDAMKATTQDRCGGVNQVPFYCVDQAQPSKVEVRKVDTLDWLSPDTDGDGLRDDVDDVDHDGLGNLQELQAMRGAVVKDRKFAPIDACVPSIDNGACLLSTVDVDKDGLDNAHDGDDDGDGLADDLERSIGTDPLLFDTDGDGVSDSFEYYSALDLNAGNLPYPGKRPYPNPLDGTDAKSDFDQDGLTSDEEYQAWLYTSCGRVKGVTPATCAVQLPLTYSDGKQQTDALAGVKDGERDVDNDGLTNWVEAHGPLSGPEWWNAFINQKTVKCTTDYIESEYPGPKYLGTSFVDPDTDGDGLKDGPDDIDHDGYTNAQEQIRPGLFTNQSWCDLYESTMPGAYRLPLGPHNVPTARMQPFNPCKPTYSSACHVHPPYYSEKEDWESPYAQDGP
jgi:Bacterial TSP3 repeat